MANTYLYGAYGHLGETVAQSAVQSGTTPVYVGCAPVNLVRGYAQMGYINTPTKVNNLFDAQKKLGYADNWEKYTLCEVFTAHFNNPLGNIGPIYVINVLDPAIHKKAQKTQKELSFINGRCEFYSDTIILDTFALENKAEEVDYIMDYNYTKNTVIISSADNEQKLSGVITANFDEVTPEIIAKDDIIGGVTANGVYSGLGALALLYQEQYQVANLIACPGYSHIPEVYNAMITAACKINGHWDAVIYADLPVDEPESTVKTIQEAINWKKTNGYNNERSKVFWPKTMDNANQVFHLSTIGIVETMRVDYTHKSIPFETCGNKECQGIKQYFGKTSKNKGYDQQTANDLTSNGISTIVSWGGNWVLWGDHTAAYTYGADVDPRSIFDVSIRMLFHITNDFQREWSPKIDKPMTPALRDRILNREQEKLDDYVTVGALIGKPKILFLASENSIKDMINGDFRWDIATTPTPPLKSATVYVAYTDEGFDAYFSEEAV